VAGRASSMIAKVLVAHRGETPAQTYLDVAGVLDAAAPRWADCHVRGLRPALAPGSDSGGYSDAMSTEDPSPATTSRRQLQREASVARILAAAEIVLSEAERFSEISVEQVISRAGVSRSTFYSYFDDLGHVLRAVGEGVVGEIVTSARVWLDLDSGVSEQQLAAIFSDLIGIYRRRADLLAALAEASASDPGVRDEFHRMMAVGHTELAKHIRRAQACGGARKSIDPESTAAWLVWMIERGLYQQIRPSRPKQIPAHVAALASIVWHALYADPQS
jgi:AcrR family transcriptional regulator